MKYQFYIFIFFLASFSAWSQIDDTTMDEMVIERISKKNVSEIIANIKKQTYNNYTTNKFSYHIFQQSIMNDKDTIITSNNLYDVSIELKSKRINKSKIAHADNSEKLLSSFFNRYPGTNDSPLYWVTEVVLRKYVNIPELDFFANNGDYNFMQSAEKGITKIEFGSDGFYEGYFKFDKKYNLVEIKFSLNDSYPIDHSQSKNGKKMFEKNWLYKQEVVTIKFALDNQQKLYIKDLKAFEEISDYNFVRYNSEKKIIVRDDNLNFKTNLHFERK